MTGAVTSTPPLVSVVVPTRDSARTLNACLSSVRRQTHRPLELIVVDNASSDATRTIAERWADVVDQAGPERSAQRNRGIELAQGSWILWIDSDMVLAPEVVAASIAAAEHGNAVAVSIPEQTVGPGFWTACRALERECYLDDPSLFNPRLIRKDYLVSIGAFDEAMSGPEDADLRLRMHRDGAALAHSGAFIYHDEGRLTLRNVLRKRYYYGLSLPSFAASHPGAVGTQARATVDAFVRHRGLLARHPAHALGLMSLRAAEALAYATGAWRGRHRASPALRHLG